MPTWQTVKESWRTPILDLDAFLSLISSTHELISTAGGTTTGQRELKRYLPSIQVQLLTVHLPTFLPTLENIALDSVRSLFAPRKSAQDIKTQRQVAFVTYRTVTPFLAAKPSIPLPVESRSFLLDVLDRLTEYAVSDAHWTIFGSSGPNPEGSREESERQLEWEEVVGALVSLPGKVANATGRWKVAGAQLDVPRTLSAKYAHRSKIVADGQHLFR